MPIRITLKRGNKRKIITCANPKRRNPGLKIGDTVFMPSFKSSRFGVKGKIYKIEDGKAHILNEEGRTFKCSLQHVEKTNPKRRNPKVVSDLYIMGIGEGRTLLRALKKEGEYNAARDIPQIIGNIKEAMRGASAEVKEVNKGELAFWKHQQRLPAPNKKRNPDALRQRPIRAVRAPDFIYHSRTPASLRNKWVVIGTDYGYLHNTAGEIRTWDTRSGAAAAAKKMRSWYDKN
jgi:hypothetical protein